MKTFAKNTFRIILFIVGFIAALYIFMPWREAGKLAVYVAHSRLQRLGMRLNYSDVVGTDGGFTVQNLTLSGMANITLSSVTIQPNIASSLLSIAPVCYITFKGAGVRLGQMMTFGDGSFLLTAGREINLEDMQTNGEFSLRGDITIDPSSMRIVRANARLGLPEAFSQNIGILRNFLPLVQEGDSWYLRR